MCLYFMVCSVVVNLYGFVCFFQAEDGIRDLVRSRGLGDVYKRQVVIKAELTEWCVNTVLPEKLRTPFLRGEATKGGSLSLIHI